MSPLASAPSLAVILLMLFHLSWRHLNPVIKASGGTVKVVWGAFPIQVFAALSDALHPWILSDRALWVLGILLSLAAGILGLSSLSPVPPPLEDTPIVQSFSVEYLERDETPMSFMPGDVIEIVPGELVLVQAEALGRDGTLCTWSAADGNLQSTEGCATLYSAPFYGTYDVLNILAQSPCKTQDACASLCVKVVSRDQ